MWTGRQTLASIETTIAELNRQEGQLDQALRSAVGDAERLRTERGEGLRELARVKLDEMAAGRLVDNLDAGERRALGILEDYRMRMAAVAEQREAFLKEVQAAEADRHAAAAAVEAALEAVDVLRGQAEAKVQATEAWRAAKAVHDNVDAVAVEAERKAAASQADLGAKKQPYDQDPLFAYLWRRRFGTADYAGRGLARLLDRMVADFIGYLAARPNYAALIEIPLRLEEHAAAKRAAVAGPRAALSDIERRAMLEAGVETKEKALAEARHRLAIADDTAEKRREVLARAEETRRTLVSGESDPAYNEALAVIAAADSKDDLATLYAEARRTPTQTDEAIVRKLQGIDAGLAKTEGEIADLRRTALDLSRRRLEVEQVRDRFRTSGYDHPQSTFQNDGALGDVLKGVLEGVVRSGVLWDLLRQGYRYRQTRTRPDFGAPDLPFPFPLPGGGRADTTGGGWREPSSGGGWAPAAPSREDDRDDFTTGGSF